MAGTAVVVQGEFLAAPVSEVDALRLAHNRLVDDVAALGFALSNVMSGAVLSAPGNKVGTGSNLKWRAEAFSFTFRGKITAAVAQEKVFTASTHDLAQNKQAWYVLSTQTDGTTYTITKAADQTIGTDVYPTGPDNEVIVGFLKLVATAAGGTWVGNTDALAVGAKIASITFVDNGAVGAAALTGNKVTLR